MDAEPENGNENGKQHPLHFMTRVSENVSVYRPDLSQQVAGAAEAAEAASGDDPALIILLGWMGAGPRPLSKFCNAFREMFPTSKILLMRSSLKHQIWQPGVIAPDVCTAVPIIQEVANDNANAANNNNTTPTTDHPARPQILIHSFSNGGTSMLSHLYRAYGEDGRSFPPHVNVFDSGPGRSIIMRAAAPITEGTSMPAPLKVAAYAFVVPVSAMYKVWYIGRNDGMDQHRETLNNVSGDVRRTYIYSESDKVLSYLDVESHARTAQEKGYKVTLEKFEGSDHNGHMKKDGERYWRIVEVAWRPAITSRL